MGKKKKFMPKKASNDSKENSIMNSKKAKNEMSGSDSDSNDLNDEINDFHINKDRELLSKSALSQGLDSDSDSDDNQSNEEILPFDDSSSDSEVGNDSMNRFAVELRKDEMASDLEDSEEELPDSKAWGNRKNVFYNTDYVDKDFRKYKQKDEDLAQYEEEEALAIQRRLLQSMSESDVGIELLIGDIEPKTASINDMNVEDEERLQTNLSNLTKRQKLEIIRKESPELEAIVSDFQTYMNEIRDRLLPLMQTIKGKKSVDLIGNKYIETRFHIIINYCINICFYMTLKAKRIAVKEHPIIKQILSYKKLLVELNTIASTNGSINRDMDLVLEKLKTGQEIEFFRKDKKQKTLDNNEDIGVNRVKFADDLQPNPLPINKSQELEESDSMAKRGITYEIAKNKGLTPKRKKELKNPRVKHRMKFRKANIRRKGQVREPRKELQRYGGEISGIKSGVVKSVKFK